VDERPIHLLVEIEIEGVERPIGVAEPRLLDAPLDQTVLPADEFVADERRDEIDRHLPFRLGLTQARLEHVGHAGEAEFPERGVEFDEIHVGSPVCWSLRSR
jgi:hypothetical protein